MKVCLLLYFTLIVPLAAQALGRGPIFDPRVSSVSHAQPIHSCYRWMSEWEFNRWKDEPYMVRWANDAYGRSSDAPTTFCWINPVGAILGGLMEDYGPNLIRIDLVEDAVIFDVTRGRYISNGSTSPQIQFKKAMDTEVVYYHLNSTANVSWFHEYILRGESVVKSWSHGDAALRAAFRSDLQRFISSTFQLHEMHFFRNFFAYPNAHFEEERGRPYYLKLLLEKSKHIEKLWLQTPDNQISINLKSRGLRNI